METVVEPLYKQKDSLDLGWRPEPGAVSYQVYVGLGPAVSLMALLATGVDGVSEYPSSRGKITYKADIADVQALLSIPATWDFSNKVFYFSLTYTDSLGATSSLADSIIIEVPPVGIIPKLMKDDPTINRHGYVFSDEIQRWTKMMGSSSGAVMTDSADFYKANITTAYTYDGTNVSSIKSYPSDATSAGMPAKLTTYTYAGSQVTMVQVTDSTI